MWQLMLIIPEQRLVRMLYVAKYKNLNLSLKIVRKLLPYDFEFSFSAVICFFFLKMENN